MDFMEAGLILALFHNHKDVDDEDEKNKTFMIKKKKIYECLKWNLNFENISNKIQTQKLEKYTEIRTNYEHDSKVYPKYRRSNIICSICAVLSSISFLLSIIIFTVTLFVSNDYHYENFNYETFWLHQNDNSSIIIRTLFIISMVFFVFFIVISCRQKYYFKPYSGSGYNQFIWVTEETIAKSYKFKYKTFEQLFSVETYFEKNMFESKFSKLLNDNLITSFDLLCTNYFYDNKLPFRKIRLYAYPKNSNNTSLISETFELNVMIVDNEPMELYYDLNKRIICLKVPLSDIDISEIKDLHIELSKLKK